MQMLKINQRIHDVFERINSILYPAPVSHIEEAALNGMQYKRPQIGEHDSSDGNQSNFKYATDAVQ